MHGKDRRRFILYGFRNAGYPDTGDFCPADRFGVINDLLIRTGENGKTGMDLRMRSS